MLRIGLKIKIIMLTKENNIKISVNIKLDNLVILLTEKCSFLKDLNEGLVFKIKSHIEIFIRISP